MIGERIRTRRKKVIQVAIIKIQLNKVINTIVAIAAGYIIQC